MCACVCPTGARVDLYARARIRNIAGLAGALNLHMNINQYGRNATCLVAAAAPATKTRELFTENTMVSPNATCRRCCLAPRTLRFATLKLVPIIVPSLAAERRVCMRTRAHTHRPLCNRGHVRRNICSAYIAVRPRLSTPGCQRASVDAGPRPNERPTNNKIQFPFHVTTRRVPRVPRAKTTECAGRFVICIACRSRLYSPGINAARSQMSAARRWR